MTSNEDSVPVIERYYKPTSKPCSTPGCKVRLKPKRCQREVDVEVYDKCFMCNGHYHASRKIRSRRYAANRQAKLVAAREEFKRLGAMIEVFA